MNNHFFRHSALLVGSALVALGAASGSQEAAAQEAGTGDELRVGTVIVTATRRDEDAQSVPVAVTAISPTELEDSLIRDTNSLQKLASSLVITVSNSETTGGVLRIRGVGTGGQNPGLEGAVGAFIDGVYRSRPGQALNDLLDVQQIEVLRGPQGTLFGKNTSAGAIVVNTSAPEFEWGGKVLGGLGDNGQQRFMASVTGPIIEDKLAFRLSGITNQRDGFIKDVNSGREYNDRDRFTVRGQLLAEPTEDVSLRLIADYTEKSEACCAAPYVLNGSRAALITSLGGTVFDPTQEDNYLVATDRDLRTDVEEFGLSAHLNWNLDSADLKVIASTRSFIAARDADVDGTDLDLARLNNERSKDRLNTLEATLQGETGKLDWLVGAYGFETDFNSPQEQVMGADLGPFLARFSTPPRAISGLYPAGSGDLLRRFYQTGSGWSLFTHNSISLTDKLTATIGLRYLEEEKSGGGQFVIRAAPSCTSPLVPAGLRVYCAVPNYQAEFKDDAMTYTGALSYQVTPNAMSYVAYSKGYKAGGISLDRAAGQRSSQVFRPEESENYELGIKTDWLSDTVQVNATLFRLEFKDFQRNVFTGTETLLSNQGEVLSQGVELETKFRPVRGLTLNASSTFADVQYGEDVSDAAIAGRQLNAAPKWTAQLGGAYTRRLTQNMAFFASSNGRYQSSTSTGADLDPLKAQDGYTLVDGRVGLRFTDQDAQISLWGTNLTDERYRVVTFNSTLQAGSLQAYMGEPRFWGIEVSKNF